MRWRGWAAIQNGPDDIRCEIGEAGVALEVADAGAGRHANIILGHGEELIAGGKAPRDHLDQIGIAFGFRARRIEAKARLVPPGLGPCRNGETQRGVIATIEAQMPQQRFGADGSLNIVLADHDPEPELVKDRLDLGHA